MLWKPGFSTAWCHNMAQTSSWYKPEDKIFTNILLSSVKLVHFCIPYKEVEVMTEINYLLGLSKCTVCQFGVLGPDSRKVSSLKSEILVSNIKFFLGFSQI